MNKIFRVIWNPTTGYFTVAGEIAKGRGKKSGRSKLFAAALISMSALIAPEAALANTGETVDTGEGVDTDGKGSPAYNGEGWVATGKDAKANIFTNEDGASTAVGFEANAGGKWSTAIGAKTAASGAASMAFGVSAESSGDRSIALGPSSQALGSYSMALGALSVARGDFSQAFGYKSTATGENTLAFGEESRADADDAIAMGTKAHARGEFSLALGAGSNTVGDSSIAFGANSYALGTQSLAFGLASQANEVNAIAIGSNSIASNVNAIALGQGSSASAENVVVIGSDASATGLNSVALGAGSLAIEDDTVSVGNSGAYGDPVLQRRIVNMAKGTISKDSTDAINGSQIYDISKSVADRLGGGATVNTTTGIVNAPNYMLRTGTAYSDVGSALTAIDNVTLQWDSRASAYSAARKDLDGKLNPTNITNVADGAIAANSTDAINGSQLNTTNTNVSNLSNTVNNIDNTVDSHSVSIQGLENDALLWDATANGGSGAFSAAHGTDKTASKITNVAVGAVTSASTDAINGSQLHSLSSNIANYFGGNASVDANGNFTGPTYNIDGKDYNSVGDALAAIDVSMADSLGDALMWDDANGSYNANHNGSASKIANVAAGTVDVASTDAVNGSQLYGVSSSVVNALGGGTTVNADGSISAPTFTIANADYNNVGDALDAIDSTLDDALLWDSSADAFSAAHGTGTTSKITNVMAGAVTSTSTDAINGSQLHDLSSNIVSYFGGDASVDANGNFTGPTYNIDGTDYTSVGDALAAIDVSMGESLGDALMWDDKANAYSASHNGTASKITDVADGNIAADSTDAVNGSQLNDTNMLINQIAGDTSSSYIEENGGGVKYVRTNDTGLAFEDASASGVGATALGYNAQASGESSVAIGQNSVSTIDGGIALGSGSMSNRVIAQGTQATSVSNSVVTIGYDTTDEQLLGALSLGKDGESYRQIINVADGTEAHDVVTVRQLQNAIGSVTTTPAKYYHANSAAEDSLAIGEDSLAMGPKTVVNADAGIGVGLNAIVVQEAINGIAIGTNAQVNHAGSIAIGSGSRTSIGAETNYLAYNMDTPQNSVGEFSVGSEDGQRKITNVAAGSQDTDAVNVGQLKVTDERVSQNTQNISILNNQVSNLDTRVTNLENGMGDIITTGSTKYFKANSTGADANAQGADSVAMGSGSIAAADNSVALGTGSVADEANTVSVGSSTNQRRITNVAAGVNDTDAVNVSQLKSSEAGSVRYDTKTDGSIDYSSITLGGGNGGTTRISNVSAGVENNDAVNYAQLKQSVQETKQYTDQRMAQMDSKLSKTESKLSGGIASAMAMTGMPQAYSPGASMASIGGGSYNGESAVALGVSMVSDNGRWVYKLQGSTNSQGEYSAAIGAGIQW